MSQLVKRMPFLLMLILLCLAAKEPKAPAMKRASQTYETALQKAQADYVQSTAAARKAYVAELRKGLDAAMKSKDLEEANAANELIERLNAGDAHVRTVVGDWTGTYTDGGGGPRAFTFAPDHVLYATNRDGGRSRGAWIFNGQRLVIGWEHGNLSVSESVSDKTLQLKNDKGFKWTLVRN